MLSLAFSIYARFLPPANEGSHPRLHLPAVIASEPTNQLGRRPVTDFVGNAELRGVGSNQDAELAAAFESRFAIPHSLYRGMEIPNATLKGDGGGFGAGSQETYQLYSGINKEFKKKYSLGVGWRYLMVDYKNGGFLYDAHMNGPIAGFSVRCK